MDNSSHVVPKRYFKQKKEAYDCHSNLEAFLVVDVFEPHKATGWCVVDSRAPGAQWPRSPFVAQISGKQQDGIRCIPTVHRSTGYFPQAISLRMAHIIARHFVEYAHRHMLVSLHAVSVKRSYLGRGFWAIAHYASALSITVKTIPFHNGYRSPRRCWANTGTNTGRHNNTLHVAEVAWANRRPREFVLPPCCTISIMPRHISVLQGTITQDNS